MIQPGELKRQALARRFGWILVMLIGLAVTAIILVRFLPGSGSEVHLKALREAGLPTNLEELNRWLPQVAPSNNAALLVMAAAEKRVAPSAALDDLLPWISPGGDLAEEKEDFETYIEKNKEALELVHRAAALPAARYPLNLTNTFSFHHLAEVKALANLLKAETVFRSNRGEPELAFRSVTNGFALARTLRHEPALIAELVRIACVAITLNSLEGLLIAQNLSSDQVAAMSEILALAEADAGGGAFGALVTERAIILHYFTVPSAEFAKLFNPTGVGNPIAEKLKIAGYRLFDIRERDERLFLEMMGKLSVAATNSYPDALRMGDEIDNEIDRRLSTGFGRLAIVSPMLHAMHSVIKKEAALLTRLRCARTALAFERYRRAHDGKPPKSLEELVPAYLAEVPRDPAVGEPLQFEETKAGYSISSPAAAAALKNPRTAVFRIPK
jgi:hypothetical protein